MADGCSLIADACSVQRVTCYPAGSAVGAGEVDVESWIDWRDREPPEAVRGISSDHLFNVDGLIIAIVRLAPGADVPPHQHEHSDEVFDVLAGQGEVLIDGAWRPVEPGMTIFVRPNSEHALRNPGTEPFVLRETIRERVYARAAIRAAVAKRLAKIGTGNKVVNR